MELWVRSQDRIKLIKVDEVKIETVKGGNTFIYSHATDLGTYTTRERALEVLDEIQKILIDYSKMSRVVYQMPED